MAKKRSAEIKNAAKRQEVWEREKTQKALAKREKKRKRQKDLARGTASAIGDDAQQTKRPRTLESTREPDATTTTTREDEYDVAGDEYDDEFAAHYTQKQPPKIMITTRPRPSRELFVFIRDLMMLLGPRAFFYPRRDFSVKQVCSFAANKAFSHVIVLGEKGKKCCSMTLSHLPHGPTAFFKVSRFVPSSAISQAGRKTSHTPELVLNNFQTRLGRRVGRFLGSLFSQEPQFRGRQVATFHTQRDYIFVRHHRYVFQENTKSFPSAAKSEGKQKPTSFPAGQKQEPVLARLQELGPQFTLRLRWLQEGTFDKEHGEFEWFHRRKQMDTSRRKFHL
mmetsp:Transcript_5873/g.18523  ORF Transcript_5873/g.18523 Transcript_5873/m.18523 type:complete len:336 (+) Transcript_5873:267-1274(+)